MEKQKVRDEIAARFGKKNWLVKVLPVAYCLTGVLLMTQYLCMQMISLQPQKMRCKRFIRM